MMLTMQLMMSPFPGDWRKCYDRYDCTRNDHSHLDNFDDSTPILAHPASGHGHVVVHHKYSSMRAFLSYASFDEGVEGLNRRCLGICNAESAGAPLPRQCSFVVKRPRGQRRPIIFCECYTSVDTSGDAQLRSSALADEAGPSKGLLSSP